MHMNYYLLVGGLQKGPFSLDELWQNGISKDTLVWRAGMAGWQKASELEELKELLEQLPPPPPDASTDLPVVPPKSWLVESILVTCLCCLPLGVIGIVYAAKVDSAFASGRYDDALRHAHTAKTWTLWGFFVGFAFILLYFLLLGIFFFMGQKSLY